MSGPSSTLWLERGIKNIVICMEFRKIPLSNYFLILFWKSMSRSKRALEHRCKGVAASEWVGSTQLTLFSRGSPSCPQIGLHRVSIPVQLTLKTCSRNYPQLSPPCKLLI